MATISCASCEQHFTPLAGYEENEQAYGCSAVCNGLRLEGFYGSTVIDAQLLEIVDPRPSWVSDGLMCDTCVQRLQNDGDAIAVETNRWFGNFSHW